MWPSLISKAKEGGLQVIETYVFWNLHEPQPGQVILINVHLIVSLYIYNYRIASRDVCMLIIFKLQFDFSGRRDIVSFIKQIQKQGLYVSLRIGLFIEGECTYG